MKLFVATPMYGGQCYGAYTDSMMKLTAALIQRGQTFKYFPIFNESHIDRARNICADEFLQSDATHLMFVDSDIQFMAQSVFELIEQDKDVVCGFYPKKYIRWQNVKRAVELGYGDDDPKDLAQFAAEMVFTPALNEDSKRPRAVTELVELHEGGSGFMLIKRAVLERLINVYPEMVCYKSGGDTGTIACFFDAGIDPDPEAFRHFLSEDYAFCRLVRKAGMQIWLAPWIKLMHHGYYQFSGSVEALAALQVPQQNARAAE
jgi:hypothetical protein